MLARPSLDPSFSQQSKLADAALPSSPSAEPPRGSQPTASPRKDKGKGKEVEIVDVEQLKGSSGKFPSSHANTVSQPAFSTITPSWIKKESRTPLKETQATFLPQNEEPDQTNDSQEGRMVHLVHLFDAEEICALLFS